MSILQLRLDLCGLTSSQYEKVVFLVTEAAIEAAFLNLLDGIQ